MKSVKTFIRYIRTAKPLTIILLVSSLVIIGSGITYAFQPRNSADQFKPAVKENTTPGSTTEKNDTRPEVATVEETQIDEDEPVKNESAPQNTGSSSAQENQRPPIPPCTTPRCGPFQIFDVVLDAEYFCNGSSTTLRLNSIHFVGSSSGADKTFTWQIQAQNQSPGSSFYHEPVTSNMSEGTNSITIRSYDYVSLWANDGEQIKVVVTQPNNISSKWFAVPLGMRAQCER